MGIKVGFSELNNKFNVNIESAKGLKGDKGDKGDPGPKGDKGDPGDSGVLVEKRYELIEEVTIAEAVSSFSRNKDTNGVPYDFSAIRIKVLAPAATAKAQIIFSVYRKDGTNLCYHQQPDALSTSETATNFVLRDDHGMVDYYCVTSAKTSTGSPKMRDGYIVRPWGNVISFSIGTYPSSVSIPAGTLVQIYAVRG